MACQEGERAKKIENPITRGPVERRDASAISP